MVKTVVPILVLWVITGSYVSWQLNGGWIPHDEGTLAHSAERALFGELPHRDFDDVYTGGLTFIHAAAFRTLGINLLSLRIVLLLFVLAWVPALYFLASRFVGPLGAGAAVLLAVAWTVPNYPASMPSWYNLFFATFGTACLMRYSEIEQRRWLVIAGLCAGVSCLIKIVGLYFVAGVLLFLVLHEQTNADRNPSGRSKSTAYRAFAAASIMLCLAAVFGLLGERLGAREFVHFVIPPTTLVGLFFWREWTHEPARSASRFASLFRSVIPFGVGLAVPVGIFLVPYLLSGSFAALLNGVFVAPMERLSFAATRPPSLLATTVAMLPPMALLGLSFIGGRLAIVLISVASAMLAVILVMASDMAVVYRLVWYSVRLLVPAVTIIGACRLMWWNTRESEDVVEKRRLLLLLCVTALTSLVQFPFSQPIYFSYVAPLAALAALAVVSSLSIGRGPAVAALCFYLLFAVMDNQGFIYTQAYYFVPSNQTETLTLERGGLRVSREEKEEYETLVPLLRQHADGSFVYAAPDCPEVYFLSGLRNPTPTIFDFFDDPTGRTARVLRQIDEHDVNVIAINQQPSFSGEIPHDLSDELVDRFPHATAVGRFQVRWKK